jgi:hypothetical protein
VSVYRTAEEYARAQEAALLDLKRFKQPFELAVRTVLANQQLRIFTLGQNSAGGRIGTYDVTRGFYAQPKAAPRETAISLPGIKLEGLRPPTGKTGKTNFKDGRPHKTTWVNNYKDYRNRIGRRVDTVDLVLTGDLRLDWSTALNKGRAAERGLQLDFTVGFKRDRNAKKREGLEDKYGPVFNLTTGEVQLFNRVLRFELARAISLTP